MKFTKKPLLPGFEAGVYESRPAYNRAEFEQYPERRSSHVNIRLSATDLERLQRIALINGVPVSSLIAGIVRGHLETLTPSTEDAEAPLNTDAAAAPAANRRAHPEADY
ncbi:MAG TPA: hypothetical protein VNR18_03485 [Hyphomicrobiales bacterium]|nr:hypothetical protein [Hyphomicrobiales bacterium]